MELPSLAALMEGALPACHDYHENERMLVIALREKLDLVQKDRDGAVARVAQLQRDMDSIRFMHQQALGKSKQAVVDAQQQLCLEYEERISRLQLSHNNQVDELNRKIAKLEESNNSLTYDLQQVKGLAALKKIEDRAIGRAGVREAEWEAKEKQLSSELFSARIQIADLQLKLERAQSQIQQASDMRQLSLPALPPISLSSRTIGTQTATQETRKPLVNRPPSATRSDVQSIIRGYQMEIRFPHYFHHF
eukprot:TRINITY_DN6347_c0_g1_i2.p1 TRINITY_DN6347_c0_g1~~TRINITY_DN6347_c0_g1_i2.p1  ORF type:complete len:250 (-),score=47.50 TRINITY_DN6347_c0_g1_i2:1151-1900(-)